MVVTYIHGHGQFYIELAGLVLIGSFVVGFGQVWLYRQTGNQPLQQTGGR